MGDRGISLASANDIEQELLQITSADYRMFASGHRSKAAKLLASLHDCFDAVPGGQKLLGVSNFDQWLHTFLRSRKVSRRNVFYFIKAGKFLLPQMSEDQFERLEHDQRNILADLAAAQRLTPEFLKAALEMSIRELRRKAAPLLGRELPWEEHLVVDNHRAAIAALIQLGNVLEYDTYTAHAGELFEGKKLSDIATLADLPRFPNQDIQRSAERIDVIWVKEKEWPDSFFEVEDSTNITSGLQRMYQVLGFAASFFIVAPKERRERFLRAISENPYKHCRDKYLFRSYPELTKIFHAALKYRKAKEAFFGPGS